jgi:hypothetical protein
MPTNDELHARFNDISREVSKLAVELATLRAELPPGSAMPRDGEFQFVPTPFPDVAPNVPDVPPPFGSFGTTASRGVVSEAGGIDDAGNGTGQGVPASHQER